MSDELKEVQERYLCMHNKTRHGDYQEIDRADLYNALHVLAKRLRGLELRSTDTIVVHEDGTVSPDGASILREPK